MAEAEWRLENGFNWIDTVKDERIQMSILQQIKVLKATDEQKKNLYIQKYL